MATKEYITSELEKEARLAWFHDDEPEPDVRVFVKDGKAGVFISITSGYQGIKTNRCVAIGDPFTYDQAYVLEFKGNAPNFSCLIALGQKGRTTIYAIEAYSANPIIEDAPSMGFALKQFGERIGLKYAPWKDLLVPPAPTWVKLRYTPEKITSLEPHQVFVFGSNAEGQHIGGAAKLAYERFGAVWGQGEGLQGHSYALPTMNLSLAEIESHVEAFERCASEHPELEFLVTKVGCGIAGFKEREIAPLFVSSAYLHNVTFPESFEKIIGCILRDEDY